MNIEGQSGTVLRVAFLTAALVATSAVVPAGHAAVRLTGNGGGLCKASNGNGAKLFYFSNLYAQNTSTTAQYLTCIIPEMNPSSARSATSINFVQTNTTGAAVTFTCAITAGYLEFGSTVNVAIYNVNVPANTDSSILSDAGSTPAIPVRADSLSTYTVSCLVPAGGRIGAFAVTFPESF